MRFLKVFIALMALQGVNAVFKNFDKLDIEEPVKSCEYKNCEYCCLSTLKCGSLAQCRSRVVPVMVLEGFFYIVVGVSIIVIVLMCVNKGKGVNTAT